MELKSMIDSMNNVMLTSLKSGREIGQQESVATIKRLTAALKAIAEYEHRGPVAAAQLVAIARTALKETA